MLSLVSDERHQCQKELAAPMIGNSSQPSDGSASSCRLLGKTDDQDSLARRSPAGHAKARRWRSAAVLPVFLAESLQAAARVASRTAMLDIRKRQHIPYCSTAATNIISSLVKVHISKFYINTSILTTAVVGLAPQALDAHIGSEAHAVHGGQQAQTALF
eukprot:3097257-Pleurochrysis_carterae.AAC.5